MAQGPQSRWWIVAIMVGLAVWAGLLAWGAFLQSRNPWSVVITIACVAVFLELWLILLLVAPPSHRRKLPTKPEGEPSIAPGDTSSANERD
jgi:membrane protein YdbS with pleckstrin-like domain